MGSEPDGNAPSSTSADLVARMREIAAELRLLKAEVKNFEALDDRRRVSIEQLLVEKRALETKTDAGTVRRAIEELEANLAEWRAQQQTGEVANLESQLAELQERELGARDRLEQLRAEHDQRISELRQERQAVILEIDENRARAETHERGLHDALEVERDRAAGLDDVLTRVRDALADATAQRCAEERELEDKLIRLSGELRGQRDGNAELDAELAEAEERCERLRAELAELAEATEGEPAGNEVAPAADHTSDEDLLVDIEVDGAATAGEVTELKDEDVVSEDDPPAIEKPLLSQADFASVLVHGARIVTTPRFQATQFSDENDLMVSRLLGEADTLEELRDLVPIDQRRDVAHRIYRFYQQGYLFLDR